jgi:hypothetical protein
MPLRYCLVVLTFPILLATEPSSCRSPVTHAPDSLSQEEFAQIIQQLSEKSGYFWSNNYISNETSYLHIMEELTELGIRDGVYIGVGPNQNFTYISTIRPKIAFVIDIRRDNMLEHLLFKILTEKAESRQEYLSFLTGRPIPGAPLPHTATIESIVEALEESEPNQEFFNEQLDHVLDQLSSWKALDLTVTDISDIERIYFEFFRHGLDIKYDSWRSFFFPTLREFLLETDLDRKHRNWLASEESYDFVRGMHKRNLIVPAIGDFAGEHAFRRLGSLLSARGETVSALYVSNVEFYLFRQNKWLRFVDNVRQLPIDDRSVFIRAYANLHRPHPEMIGNHITVTLVQNIRKFLDNADRGLYRDLWDVVTVN